MNQQLLLKIGNSVDELHRNEDASIWIKSFFEKRPSAGYPDAANDPVDFVSHACANHYARTEAMAEWVNGLLEQITLKRQPGPTNLREEFLLSGLLEWCYRWSNPELFGPRLIHLLEIAEPNITNGWTSDLTRSFKYALVRNQVDDSLEYLWADHLDNQKPDHGFTRYWPDDFEGLLHMPGSNEERFEWSAIGYSLKTIYDTLLPGYSSRTLSPVGPMRDLYRRLKSIADLDEPELNSKLWDLATEAKWTQEQEQTIPLHFFKQQSRDWVIPRVALELMLGWRNLGSTEIGAHSVVLISAEAYRRLDAKEIQIIQDYEKKRKNSPRNFRPEMFPEQMGLHIPAKRVKQVLQRKQKQKRVQPVELLREKGSSLFLEEEMPNGELVFAGSHI